MNIQKIREELFLLQDKDYADFQRKLLPTLDPTKIIGVRTPELKKIVKKIKGQKSTEDFLQTLPHTYFEENQLHAFLIAEIKDMDTCVKYVDKYLPYVDNWATCDQLNPSVFKGNKQKLYTWISMWITCGNVYSVRFGIKMLMDHFLEEEFSKEYLKQVSEIRSEEYYVKMMIAWYFATALAKQYETVLPWIKEGRLEPWIHRKTIQKAIESRRLSEKQKEELRQFRILDKSRQ